MTELDSKKVKIKVRLKPEARKKDALLESTSYYYCPYIPIDKNDLSAVAKETIDKYVNNILSKMRYKT